jgi:inosine-uridine nucleoside N-ribohydrolase
MFFLQRSQLVSLMFAAALTACQSVPDAAVKFVELPRAGAVILDADTANEMDDLYAVAQVVLDPNIEIAALSSAHFNNTEIGTKGRWHGYDTVRELDRGLNTVGASQKENEALLTLLGREDIPAPFGASEMLGFSWGYFEGADVPDAPAIQDIIKRAQDLESGEKLDVVLLGPLTNAAAAIAQAPDIAPKLRLWWLGCDYDVETGVWNKNAFNARNDLNAVDFILDRDDVELIMLSVSVARDLMFQRNTTLTQLAKIDHPLIDALSERWDFVQAEGGWIMWDMALTLAIAHPEWAEARKVAPPPENKRESVTMITKINAPAMEAYFFELMQDLNSQ